MGPGPFPGSRFVPASACPPASRRGGDSAPGGGRTQRGRRRARFAALPPRLSTLSVQEGPCATRSLAHIRAHPHQMQVRPGFGGGSPEANGTVSARTTVRGARRAETGHRTYPAETGPARQQDHRLPGLILTASLLAALARFRGPRVSDRSPASVGPACAPRRSPGASRATPRWRRALSRWRGRGRTTRRSDGRAAS